MDKKKILIVEDDRFLREVYFDSFMKEGYIIDIAEDGEKALEKMSQGEFDVVLLDIVLPKMSGFDVMKKYKQSTSQNNKVVLFLTNLDDESEMNTALSLGDGYLIKSDLTPGELIAKVKTYL